MIEGVDLSHWQGVMDFAKLKSTGVKFAIIRAGSIDNSTGICYTDFQYEANVKGCQDQGIPFGAYWFFRPNHSAARQAEYFLNLAAGQGIITQLRCDIEVAGSATVVKSFCDALSLQWKVGIYTNPNTALYLLSGDKAWMKSYPLWLADWTAPANPPKPWTSYQVWQYAVKPDGKVYGAQSASIDHNTADDSFLTAYPPPPAPVDPLDIRVTELEIKSAITGNLLQSMDAKISQLEIMTARNEKDLDDYVTALVTLTKRVDALTASQPVAAKFHMASRKPASCMDGQNAVGKPMFHIYPSESKDDQSKRVFLEGDIQVLPTPILGDSAAKMYPVYKSAPTQLYVHAEDGELKA